MRGALLSFFVLLILTASGSKSFCQNTITTPVKVAVFVPIYINEAFSGSTYKLGKHSLPKNILPGLEFYNGVMMAIDSLNNEGASVEVSIYDTKNVTEYNSVLQGGALNSTGLIIAALTNTSELQQLANVAQKKKIPLISATYPNSGSVTANPNFVLLNSTLQAHVEGIYKILQKKYSFDNVIVVKKNGNVENSLRNMLNNLNKNTLSVPVIMKFVDLPDGFTDNQLARYMDSTRKNVIVVASPYEDYGLKVVKAASTLESYLNTVVIGMPTWDGINEFDKSTLTNVEVVYSTPFNYSRYSGLGADIARTYRDKYQSRPSDMVFKGYESMYHFTKLLMKHRQDLVNHLSDTDYTLFNQFNIQPVKLTKDATQPDYHENKKLYFIHKNGGEVVSVVPLG